MFRRQETTSPARPAPRGDSRSRGKSTGEILPNSDVGALPSAPPCASRRLSHLALRSAPRSGRRHCQFTHVTSPRSLRCLDPELSFTFIMCHLVGCPSRPAHTDPDLELHPSDQHLPNLSYGSEGCVTLRDNTWMFVSSSLEITDISDQKLCIPSFHLFPSAGNLRWDSFLSLKPPPNSLLLYSELTLVPV